MNKKLIAAAIAAAVVAAPAAFAEATLYGKMHTSIDKNDFETGGEIDNWSVESRASRVGIKGSEDLGGGLKAIYQFETHLASEGDGGPWGSQRNTFVGLSGGFGTFVVGRHDTPKKMASYATGVEIAGDTAVDMDGGLLGVLANRRVNDAIAYVSPNFSGLTIAAAIVPGEEAGTSGTDADNRDGLTDAVSVGAMYRANGLRLAAGYEKLSDVGAGAAEYDDKMWFVGGSYTMNNFMVGATYEDRSDAGAVDVDTEAWVISAKATFGNNAIGAMYTMLETDRSGTSTDSEQKGWGVIAEHNMSKRTKVYAAYADRSVDNDSAFDPDGAGPLAAGADTDDDVFSLGMIHNF